MKKLGIEINLPEGHKIVKYEPSDEIKRILSERLKTKCGLDYIKEFLQSQQNFDKATKTISNGMNSNIPIDAELNCLVCKNLSNKFEDQGCNKYRLQMDITYFIAVDEYVRIILNNPVIYENKEELLNLTIQFYNCFLMVKKEGKMYFDLEKISSYALNANCNALSKIFEDSPALKGLEIVNSTLNSLNETDIENTIFGKEDNSFVKIQMDFLQRKQVYLNEKLRLNQLNGITEKTNSIVSNSTMRPNRTDLAYFIYYLNETNIKILNSVFPSEMAWKELGDKFDKNSKNIQKVYNIIYCNSEQRISKKKIDNIKYVIENMLTEYIKASKLAKDELKLAQLKL